MPDQPTITDQTIQAYTAACLALAMRSIEAGTTFDADEGVRAGLAAAAPHIAAQALRTYADQQHPHAAGHARRVDYGTGVEYDTECAGCGSSWSEVEGGCTERVELLRAANALVMPPACSCHETGAPCNCAD